MNEDRAHHGTKITLIAIMVAIFTVLFIILASCFKENLFNCLICCCNGLLNFHTKFYRLVRFMTGSRKLHTQSEHQFEDFEDPGEHQNN